ncbi:MAG: TIGR01212 family radical SAM protein [Lachnospiraceae bacterium]|nr:TIGR01212 family radical SAM protein [Lachnospiraceae bacterium]
MLTVNEYCRQQFGQKLYKLSLDGGMTCPNRDGTLDTRGCIFCSAGGSGDFTPNRNKPIEDQIDEAKEKVSAKYKGDKYIAYFQAYTNTYAPVETLRQIFIPVINRDDIAVLSIATRPDCLSDKVLALLDELNQIKPVWVELGLQTIHEKTADYIRRGYQLAVYDKAICDLNAIGIHTITHIILGLPEETKEDMLASVRHVVLQKSKGIKLQLLHVLKNTDLAKDYQNGLFKTMEFEEYMDLVAECAKLLPPDMVVHRLTGDGPKSLLIAPLWSADKKRVLNALHKKLDSALGSKG